MLYEVITLDNKDSKDYFDTYITLEKSSIVKKEEISEDARNNFV